jgi:hypothetical protein
MPHNVAQWWGWPHRGSWRNSDGARFPGMSWRGFVFDLGVYECQCIKCPWGSRYEGSGTMRSTSEAHQVFSSRSRRDLARGGVQPSSEAESSSRGRPAPERSGTSPEGATSPRARQSFISAAPCPSSEAEFHPRVVRPTAWRAVGPWVYLTCVFRFVCVCFLRR